MNLNKNLKRKIITAVMAVVIAVSAVTGVTALPSYAGIGSSVNEEVVNQARAIASIIQTRIQLYWSMWVDKQIPYTQNPLTSPEPSWATDAEIAAAIGGYEPEGVSFTVESMPLDRKGSFYLTAEVDGNMGGAAAAAYVRNFLPMALANGNSITVPVLRPSFALGLSDLMDNPNKVNRDGSTDDGSSTFTPGSIIRFGDGGTITFDGTGGDMSNINNLSAVDGTFSNNLTVGEKLKVKNAEIDNADIGKLKAGDTEINGDIDVSGLITGNLHGNTSGIHTGPVVGNVTGNLTGNADTASRLAVARSIALSTGATSNAVDFSGASNITIPVTSLNAGYLNAGRIPTARLEGTYDIGVSGKASTAGAADTARYSSTAGLLKDTDGDTPGQFTVKTTSGGTVEFGGTASRTSVIFTGPGITDWKFGTNGAGILHGQATSATKLAVARTIALDTGVVGTPTAFDGTGNIIIPVTALNAGRLTGTVDAERLSGLYNISISGKANTAGQADYATNVNGGTVNAAAGVFSGTLTVNGRTTLNNDVTIYGDNIDRNLVFDGSSANTGKWRLAHTASGSEDSNYFRLQSTGSSGSTYSDVLRFGMNTKDAVFSGNILPSANNAKDIGSSAYKFANIYATNIRGDLTGNAESSTKLATARTIALGTGVTGTATAFDGTGNITIPVTALDASKLSSGVIPTARLSGTYNIGISGKATTAGTADTAVSATTAASATKLSTARSLNVTGAVIGTPATFDGTGNVNIVANELDPTKLMTGFMAGFNIRHNAKIFNSRGNVTGAIEIKMPMLGDAMPNIELDVYDQNMSASKIIIGGRTQNKRWLGGNYCSVSILGKYDKGVRLAFDGSNPCVILGNTSTAWNAVTVNVSKVTDGYNGGQVREEWTIFPITDESGLENIVTPTVTSAPSATKLAAARTISVGTGVIGTPTAFDGTENITIPITALNASYLSSGTVGSERLNGTYNIGISGKAATAGTADSATTAASAVTAANISGGSVNATTGTFSGLLTANKGISLYNNPGHNPVSASISYWTPEYNAWQTTMSKANAEGNAGAGGINNNIISPAGTYVTNWALRSIVEHTAGNGWTWERMNLIGTQPTIAAELDIAGNFKTKGIITSDGGFSGNLIGNATTATKLATARTIALGTGATGTATAFDGMSNIIIPITEVNATYLLSGTLPTARLSGTYNIGISGKAATAGAADTASTAASATKLSTARNINVTGAVTGTAATFDGTGNVNIAVDRLDPTKLMAVTNPSGGSAGIGVRHNVVNFRNQSSVTPGALKITIPPNNPPTNNQRSASMCIELDIYEYDVNYPGASKIIIGGSPGLNYWYRNSVSIIGPYNKGVRLGNDESGAPCILLGDTTTVFQSIMVNVSKVTADLKTIWTGVLDGEWTISLITDESGLSNISTPAVSVQPATKLAIARTIAIGTGATGTATAFDGTSNITIPITALNASYLSSGTVGSARLSGTYNIGISGKAATAGAADSATTAASAVTAANISGGSVNATTGTFSGLLTANKGLQLNRAGSPSAGISYYTPSFNSWQTIMSNAGEASGVNGNVVSPAGTYVTTWALRNIVEPGAGKGWTWESMASSGTTSAIVAELSSATGNFKTKGSVTADGGFSGELTGNASTATQLAVARTIALGTAATGTPTAFNGTVNITIPVTALNASYLSAGTIPASRMTGTYDINISGTAELAKGLTGGISSVAYAVEAGTATNLNGGTVNATTGTFSGLLTANKGLQLNRAGSPSAGISYYSPSYNSWQTIMSNAGVASGVNGNVVSPAGTYVTTWALRNIIEASTTYGWTWESMAATGTTSAIVAELNAYTGNFKTKGSVTAASFVGNLSGTASSATYATSSGSTSTASTASTISGVSLSAPANMLIFNHNNLKVAYGTGTVNRNQAYTVTFPTPFTNAVRLISGTGTVSGTKYTSPTCTGEGNTCVFSFIAIGF